MTNYLLDVSEENIYQLSSKQNPKGFFAEGFYEFTVSQSLCSPITFFAISTVSLASFA